MYTISPDPQDTAGSARSHPLSPKTCALWIAPLAFLVLPVAFAQSHRVGAPPQRPTGLLICESTGNRVKKCRIAAARITLQKQLSKSACIEGKTWGSGKGEVWVSNGCRARFSVAGTTPPAPPTRPPRRPWEDSPKPHQGQSPSTSSAGPTAGFTKLHLTCESSQNRRNKCQIPRVRPVSQVSLVRQFSNAPCVQGETWGYNREHIWVTDGCRASFEGQ